MSTAARTTLGAAGGLALALLAAALDLLQGADGAGLAAVRHALTGGSGFEEELIRTVRGSRAAAGLVAGATLGGATVLLQSLTRNPLAEPATLGLSSGGMLAVTIGAAYGGVAAGAPTILVAFVGVLVAALLVAAIAAAGGTSPVRLVLTGMAIGLALAAITGAVRLLRETETSSLYLWGGGSLLQLDWVAVRAGTLIGVPALLLAALLARGLDVVELGEESARALGSSLRAVRLGALAVAAVLTAVSVGVAGPFAFAGILAAGAGRLVRPSGSLGRLVVVVPWAAAAILLADVLTRAVFGATEELPAGVMCALAGAPVVVMIARRIADDGPMLLAASRSVSQWRASSAWLLVAALPLCVVAALCLGEPSIGPVAALRALVDGSRDLHPVIAERAERVAVATLTGAALAGSGVILQGTLRNPFAGPELAGVTGGASVGALAVLLLFPGAPGWALPLAAYGGSAAALAIVLLAATGTRAAPARMALIGLAITAAAASITTLMVLRSQPAAAEAITWLAGSTYARTTSDAILVGVPLLLLGVLAMVASSHLDVLATGDELATALGLNVPLARALLLALGAALAAAAVAVCGAIAFLGLLAPHLARLVAGGEHRRLLPVAMATGAALLAVADLVGRALLPPLELPSGLVVAAIGAPALVLTLIRTRGAA
ncbi:MAG: iron chelate uptake ABC transporter family permease subunit [Patulibacter sp.]